MQAAVYYGKPNPEPYRLMEALLRGQAARLGHDRCWCLKITPATPRMSVALLLPLEAVQLRTCGNSDLDAVLGLFLLVTLHPMCMQPLQFWHLHYQWSYSSFTMANHHWC